MGDLVTGQKLGSDKTSFVFCGSKRMTPKGLKAAHQCVPGGRTPPVHWGGAGGRPRTTLRISLERGVCNLERSITLVGRPRRYFAHAVSEASLIMWQLLSRRSRRPFARWEY